jgi:hypothetical protein
MYRHILKAGGILALAGIASLAAVKPAEAALMLQLDDPAVGGIEVTVVDGDADGVVVWNGALGGTVWTINITTGLSKPALPGSSATSPHMDLNSVNVSGGGAGTLNILLSDTDWSDAVPGGGFTLLIGGTAQNTVAYSAYTDLDNVNFALDNLIAATGPLGPGAFSATLGGPAATDLAYSITQVIQIVHTAAGVSSFDAELLPEPMMLSLFGLGLVGLAARSRRRARQ